MNRYQQQLACTSSVSRISLDFFYFFSFQILFCTKVEKYVSKINRIVFLANLLKSRTLAEHTDEREHEHERVWKTQRFSQDKLLLLYNRNSKEAKVDWARL